MRTEKFLDKLNQCENFVTKMHSICNNPTCVVFYSRIFRLHTLCLKNDTDVAYYNFNKHQPIFIIFGRDVAERVC